MCDGAAASECDDREDPGADEEELPKRAAFEASAMEVGNEVGHRHIQEVSGRECENVGEDVWHRVGRRDHADRSENAADARQQVECKRPSAGEPGPKQDGDIAYLLRN